MKIGSNYVLSAVVPIKSSFGNDSVGINSSNDTPKVDNIIPNTIVPDYNVSTPMKYSFIDNIKLPNGLNAKYYKLANGQKIILVNKKGPTVVKTYVNTGSMNEPDNLRGISHFIEHNLFNGSEALGEKVFFEEVNKMGAETNASTSFSLTDYYINSPILDKNDLENDIKLHAGMLQTPKFLEERLEKEKKIVNSEINMCLSNVENLGYTHTLKNLFNIKTTSKDLIAGTTDNISNLKRSDVINYYKNNYYPSNMITVITGDIDDKKTMKLVSKYFTSTYNPQKPRHYEKFTPTETSIRTDIISPKITTDLTSIFLGFTGPKNSDAEENLKTSALLTLLSMLNNSRNSDTELNYGVHIDVDMQRIGTRPSDPKMILFNVNTSENNSENLIKDVYKNISSIISNPPTEDEMTAIKNKLKKGHNQSFEKSEIINYIIGESFLDNYYEKLNKIPTMIDNLTPQDIVETAKKYLDLNKVSITVVHPSFVTENDIKNRYSELNKKELSPINKNNIEIKTLPNNANIIFNNTDSDIAQISLTMRNRDFKSKNSAISDILNLILNDYGEDISKNFDKYAVDIDLDINKKSINLLANFPHENSKNTIGLFNHIINSPQIDEETVANAKEILLKKYSMCEVSPYNEYNKVMRNKATIEDKIRDLENITTEDVKNYYSEMKNNAQINVVVCAPFEKNPELKELFTDNYLKYENLQPWNTELKSKYKPIEKTMVLKSFNNKNQAQILEGFKFPFSGDLKEETTLILLNQILGGSTNSRLFNDLREARHLAYNVNSNVTTDENQGIFTLQIKTTTNNLESGENTYENIEKSIKGFNENIDRLRKYKVSEEELLNAKKAIKADIMSLEDNFSKNIALGEIAKTKYGINYLDEQLNLIDKITVEDINKCAKNIFATKPIYSISGTKDAINANEDFLNSL